MEEFIAKYLASGKGGSGGGSGIDPTIGLTNLSQAPQAIPTNTVQATQAPAPMQPLGQTPRSEAAVVSPIPTTGGANPQAEVTPNPKTLEEERSIMDIIAQILGGR